ncbi:methyl-accepting chemotaxis protein [Bacillus lumedeiriae]
MQITESILEVSEGTARQLNSARSSHVVVEEMAEAMDQAASSIQSVSNLAISTANYTESGTTLMESTVKKMEEIQTSTQSTASVVQSLSRKSTEIEKIISLITNVADQTNLLALNAAIEAARAGEHGKGFAVVADEVRKLAVESGSAAGDIRQLIRAIQQEIEEVISAMQIAKEFVSEGLAMAQESGSSFHEISKMISEVSTQAEEISAITEEVNASTQSVKELADDVAVMSEKADERSQTVTAAVEEQNAIMEEISASAKVLSSMSEELKDMISSFRIN